MVQDLLESGFDLMKDQRYHEALGVIRRVLDSDPSNWNAWYLAGQCCRFLGDLDGAIRHLSRAVALNVDSPPVFLALGIAFQMQGKWKESIDAFHRAIEIDPDYVLAYNSLALTQRKSGEYEKALHNYDVGARVLGRRIVGSMQNSRSSPIVQPYETIVNIWMKYASYAMLASAVAADSGHVLWMSDREALVEEQTHEHEGLFWVDVEVRPGKMSRLFLPNFFNTFKLELRMDSTYCNLMGNLGTVLDLLGREEEARQHYDEAAEFLP